jgi:hypothetical protein
VRVRDLEIALVLAREMKAAAERSVDASLRLDQLQEVFGVQELDRAERARIQTALQMAGLEPFPSLLEADPSEPIRFGATKTAVASGAASPPPPAAAAPAPPTEEMPAGETQPAFPTVGQFARSKLRSRRFGVRRGDHGEDDAPPPEPPTVERNGYPAAEVELHEEPELHDEEPLAEDEELRHDEPGAEEEPVADEAYEEHEPVVDVEPEHPYEEPEPQPDQREYIPLAHPQPEPGPVAYAEPDPEPQPVETRSAEVVAALLPAVLIPVIVTSIAGWQFGLPFVALTVVAAGWMLSREKLGFFASIRGSRAARTVLTLTAALSVLSGAAAVVLASLPDKSPTSRKAATPAPKRTRPPVASKPATPPKPHKKAKPIVKHHHRSTPPPRATAPAPPPTKPAPPATTPAPAADPATQGLIRVAPSTGAGTKTTP